MNPPENLTCSECGRKVKSLPTILDYKGEEVFVFYPVVC